MRNLAQQIRACATLNGNKSKMYINQILSRFLIKAEKPTFFNMKFAKESDFKVITNSIKGVNVQRILYKITDTRTKSFTVTVSNYSPRSTLKYAVDKGGIGFIPWPSEILTQNKTIIDNPYVYRNDLEKDEIYHVVIDVWNTKTYDFEIVPNLNEIPDDGPNLIALWVIMGLTGATAFIIGRWFIYNCLLDKEFF